MTDPITIDNLLLLEKFNASQIERRQYEQRMLLRWRSGLQVVRGLQSLGLWPAYYQSDSAISRLINGWGIEVKIDQLPLLREVFPQVKDTQDYRVEDANNGLVQVSLDLGFPGSAVRVYYVKQLPADARCKIVVNTFSDPQVVCSI